MDKKILLLWMCILTCLAGAINAISIFGYSGTPGTTVSHVTGLISNMAIHIANGSLDGLWDFLRVILLFFAGSIVSGIVTAERAFYLHKRYGFIIIAIGLLIIIPFFLPADYSILVLAFAMGLQNGMVVSFKGVVVRMTHMTGNITDLGVFLGYKIRGNKKELPITGIIPFVALVSFVLGGIGGILLYNLMHNYIFFLNSGIYLLVGGIYFILREKCRDRNFNGIPDELEKPNTEEAAN